MRSIGLGIVALGSALILALPASALNIVLTNDDGFETENIQALFRALTDAGHNVIMSAPYLGQSGTGGKIAFLQPLFPTSEPSEGGLLPAGSFPIGETTIAPQQFYVDESPAAAALYGIDVLAPQIFGGPPDLVVSGPNEGNNLGLVTPHSGTLGAAVTALNKGIPAIAVSADSDDETTEEAELIAAVTLAVVESVDASWGLRLPRGTGLNVNIPDVDPAENDADDFDYKLTRIGTAAQIGLQFYEDLGDSPIAQAFGIPAGIGLPGTSVEIPYTNGGYAEDTSSRSEGNVVGGTTVAVSPIQGTYAADFFKEFSVRRKLRSLFYPRR
ncbi:MAG: 5'/3'-nucleotidase SurE [Myxococcota bacterium]